MVDELVVDEKHPLAPEVARPTRPALAASSTMILVAVNL